MAKYLEIDTSSLARDEEKIRDAALSAGRKLAALKKSVYALSATWEGEAHAAFLTRFEEDYAYMQQFLKELQSYADTMAYAGREYESCEMKVSEVVSSIGI